MRIPARGLLGGVVLAVELVVLDGALDHRAAAAVAAVAEAKGRDRRNVHVIYEPPGRGRVAFGGELLT